MVKGEVAFYREGLQLLRKKNKSEIFDAKKNIGQFSDLRGGIVKKRG